MPKTAALYGIDAADLQVSERANHEGALKAIRREEGRHGRDFPTLAALWNAGRVLPSSASPWGVVTDDPHTMTSYASSYNRAGAFMRARELEGLPPLPSVRRCSRSIEL